MHGVLWVTITRRVYGRGVVGHCNYEGVCMGCCGSL